MIHSLYLVVEKRQGDESPVSVGTAFWRGAHLPAKQGFVDDLVHLYGLIEPPFHVHRAGVEIVTDVEVMLVESAWPIDPPQAVAEELWAMISDLKDMA